jgi:hypothetical protein
MSDSATDTLIDLTIANAALVMELRKGFKAMQSTMSVLHPEFEKLFRIHFAEADERGAALHTAVLEASQKLTELKSSTHSTDKDLA